MSAGGPLLLAALVVIAWAVHRRPRQLADHEQTAVTGSDVMAVILGGCGHGGPHTGRLAPDSPSASTMAHCGGRTTFVFADDPAFALAGVVHSDSKVTRAAAEAAVRRVQVRVCMRLSSRPMSTTVLPPSIGAGAWPVHPQNGE
ncbi:hypothetical protein [Nonomuraea sp. NPDC003709]|uniref:hypothetical protein n=1 Tax=Nonomuraea sp. NPDC003709 TaxID=3154450 RepID=UPI0033AD5990